MKVIVPYSYGHEFIFEYLPSFIFKYSISSIYKYKSKIDTLLKNNFHLTLQQFIDEYKKSFAVKKFGKYYIVSIKQNKVSTIMRTIDYGCIGFPALHLFTKIFNYAQENLGSIHNMWLRHIPV